MEIEDGPREYLWSTPRHMNRELGEDMDRFAISATLEARPGKEGEVEEF
jgi:hypothetical protein